MQVKLFTIRMDSDNLEIDQNSLNDFLETITFKKSDTHFVESDTGYWSVLVHYEEEIEIQKEAVKNSDEMNLDEQQVFKQLKKWRTEKAQELGFKSFMICYDSELTNIAIKKPNSIEELKKIKGFSNIKSEKYGTDIISILKSV